MESICPVHPIAHFLYYVAIPAHTERRDVEFIYLEYRMHVQETRRDEVECRMKDYGKNQ